MLLNGDESSTHRFFEESPLVAFIFLVTAIIAGQLWYSVLIKLTEKVVKSRELSLTATLTLAFLVTFLLFTLSYFLDVSIQSAFSY